MNTDIKHKHSGHVIAINGQTFKANDRGQWNLTDIWQVLKLPKGKAPGRWRNEDAKELRKTGDLRSQILDAQIGKQREATVGSKLATIEYAAWVSREFKRVVFHAFEAVLEIPEVAKVVAAKMDAMGRAPSAGQLRDMFGLTERESERLAMSGKLDAYIKRKQASQKS
ncbi:MULTISPECIES: hypothetical protein [Pseudomonas]|uniref:hypothetical protein n=1 Tax=Pseudomonas TaxID=286 RepID=UPI00125D306B|nr:MULTISPECIES: hypothetical protein [Pseudomonas]MCE0999537.1 hypothetical protein [Pseudomonas sp. NMI1173_11]